MSTPAEMVRVWPSAAARKQGSLRSLHESPSGFIADPRHYTWNDFLPSVLEQVALPSGWQTLLPLAGPMLVRQIIAENQDNPQWSLYAGQALGRKLPGRLWRLLVEMKSARLNPAMLSGMKSPRIRSAGLLLAEYDRRLKELRLMDQADCLDLLETQINKGQKPGQLALWPGVEAKDVLWLRSMDLRLLRALGGIMPVNLEFALAPPHDGSKGVFRLLEATAGVLERDGTERVAIQWRSDDGEGLGRIVESMLAGKPHPGRGTSGTELELLLAPGRYAEVSRLIDKTLALLEAGSAAGDIVIAFPDLDIYGQMCLDLGKRTGIQLDSEETQGLVSAPLVNWFISLLELPSVHFRRRELAKVLSSPFCSLVGLTDPGNMTGLKLCSGDLDRRLKRYGYMDSRELLEADKNPKTAFREAGEPRHRTEIQQLTNKIARFTDNIYGKNDLKGFLETVSGLLGELRPLSIASSTFGRKNRGIDCVTELARATVFDLMSHRKLVRHVDEALLAAKQIEATERVSFRRGMALLKDTLSQVKAPKGRAPLTGIRVTSIEKAAGLRAAHIMVGGLAQGEFPRRPAGGELLTGSDRMELGRRAGLPVWRTDEEEYGGQVLGLAMLMSQADASLTLSAPGADSDGSPKEPIHVFKELSDYLNIKLKKIPGGAFGGRHGLSSARDSQGLWSGLCLRFCAPGNAAHNEDRGLGQAALYELGRHEPLRDDWQDLRQRVREESLRLALDDLQPEQRRELTSPFSGRLTSREALDHLVLVLDQPAMRRLSPSSLESLAACPAAWFWGRIMGLGAVPAPEWDLERREEGDWVHAALRLFFEPGSFMAEPPEDLEGVIATCLDKARESLTERGMFAHWAAWEARKQVLAVSLAELARNEYQDMQGMIPHAVEQPFGGEGNELRLGLLSRPGQALNLAGRVDRIDLGPEQVRITDYKHSTNAANLRKMAQPGLFGQAVFQLPVYLAAAKALLGDDYSGQFLSARILPTILLGIKPPMARMEPTDIFLAQQSEIRNQALKNGEINLFNSIELLWLGILKGDFSPAPHRETCAHCEVRHVCRANLPPGAAQPEESDQ